MLFLRKFCKKIKTQSELFIKKVYLAKVYRKKNGLESDYSKCDPRTGSIDIID